MGLPGPAAPLLEDSMTELMAMIALWCGGPVHQNNVNIDIVICTRKVLKCANDLKESTHKKAATADIVKICTDKLSKEKIKR